jgi:molybdate transport system substrate-binding protein
MKLRSALIALSALALAGAAASGQDKVVVAAASNLSALKVPLSEAFSKKHPGYAAEFVFGASGALVAQIESGAPYQVFMSADRGFAQAAADAGMAVGQPETYAIGKLLLFSAIPVDLSKGLAILADPAVSKWANCNPETAPYGRAAKEALASAGLYERVSPKLVTAQSVTQALQFALSGADAGFINKSALYASEMRRYDAEGKYWIEVDPRLYAPIEQACVLLSKGASSPAARAFVGFLRSPEAKSVFAAFGYGTP